jgi:hypothetical protein
MTLELFFIAGSFVIGVVELVEARTLLRQAGALRGAVVYTSAVEFLWAILCLYLLAAGRLEASRWLAIMFIAYIPVSSIVSILADRTILDKPPDAIRVPKVVAYMGGLFGAAYAIAALSFLYSPPLF